MKPRYMIKFETGAYRDSYVVYERVLGFIWRKRYASILLHHAEYCLGQLAEPNRYYDEQGVLLGDGKKQ